MKYPIQKLRWFVVLVLLDLAWNYWGNRNTSDFWGIALPTSVFQIAIDGIVAIITWQLIKLVLRPSNPAMPDPPVAAVRGNEKSAPPKSADSPETDQ